MNKFYLPALSLPSPSLLFLSLPSSPLPSPHLPSSSLPSSLLPSPPPPLPLPSPPLLLPSPSPPPRSVPAVLDYLSYCFNFLQFLAGPTCTIREYQMFINGTNFAIDNPNRFARVSTL